MMQHHAQLCAALVFTLMACTSCTSGIECVISGYSWYDTPSHGVHVGRAWPCDGPCRVSPHDVILSVDGVAVETAADVYEILSDHRKHKLTIHQYFGNRNRDVAVRFDADELRHLGLSSMHDAQSTSLPSSGWGERQMFMLPKSRFVGAERAWEFPTDLLGQVHVIVDIGRRDAVSNEFSGDVDGPIESFSLPLFVVGVGIGAEGPRALPALPERWHANPHVTSVVTYVDQVSEFGMSGYLSDLGGFGGLHIEVVDCHGVVRWSLDHPILDQPVDVLFTRALEFAEDLERERAAGACWDGIASAN